jgi:hypothetical protein
MLAKEWREPQYLMVRSGLKPGRINTKPLARCAILDAP